MPSESEPMYKRTDYPNRRAFLESGLKSALAAAVVCAFTRIGKADEQANAATALFDGKTLDGWIDIENSSTAFGGGDIVDLSSLAKKLTDKSDAVSAFLSDQLDDAVRTALASFSPSSAPSAPSVPGTPASDPTKALSSALAKNLSKIISGASIYDAARFKNVSLRLGTQALLSQNPQGRDLVQLNRMLLEDAFPSELAKSVPIGWMVKGGVIASTGVGRGVLYTANDYSRFRLIFTMRHVSGNPDHPANILFFCSRPLPGQMPLDALGGIQFQVPKGGHWDYRPGYNDDGGAEFTGSKLPVDLHEWSRIEILADASAGTARMAVAQPIGSKAVEVLDFKDPTAGKIGPIALQMHNAGLFDEYKDITIEVNPKVDELITLT